MRIRTLAPVLCAALLATRAEAVTFVVTNTNTSGAGSLAQAIADANLTAAADEIEFNIAGVGVKTIAGNLPAITQPLSIDGYTQPTSETNTATNGTTNAELRIVLDGSDLTAGESVLDVKAGPTTIRGLVINGMSTKGAGIFVDSGVTGVSVLGCFLGTNAKANADASTGNGIIVRGTAQIGTSAAPDLNVISGNDGAGVLLRSQGSEVQGNLIGTNLNGLPVLGNGIGIQLLGAAATENLIGGLTVEGNTIAGNELDGIRLNADAGSGNTILRNRIHDNGALGIDLGGDGPTLNDEDDADTGPNDRINAPELAFARLNNNSMHIQGLVRGAPGAYTLNTYLNDDADPSGFGEGQIVGGAFAVNVPPGADAANFSVGFNLGAGPHPVFQVTATITRDGSTSEFSRAVAAVQGGDEIAVTNTNDSGAGSLRAAVQQANGTADPETVIFQIPGAGPHTIALQSFLVISQPIVVDGYSQAGAEPNTLLFGSDADLRVAIDASAVAEPGALSIGDTSAVVRGLSIHSAQKRGIRAIDGDGLVVEGCFLGVGPDGVTDLGNGDDAIQTGLSTNVSIGGPNVGQRNVLSGNGLRGVLDTATGTVIVNNLIGVAADGLTPVPNDEGGIFVQGEGARIGGDEPGFGNVIRSNSGSAIVVGEAEGVEILGNEIADNEFLGIDLFGVLAHVVTENDVDDADAGANGLQNFPVLIRVDATPGVLEIDGLLDVPADREGTKYTLRAYASSACDASGHGEGERFLGRLDVKIPEGEEFSIQLPADVADGEAITMTATDPLTGNTSEFSACLVVGAAVCGDANGDEQVKSGDALIALGTAVGSASCDDCVCDVNESGGVNTTDALLILRRAVAQPVVLACPACE